MVGPGWDGEDEPGVGLGQAKNGAGDCRAQGSVIAPRSAPVTSRANLASTPVV